LYRPTVGLQRTTLFLFISTVQAGAAASAVLPVIFLRLEWELMARTSKDGTVRRNEILDVAQRLMMVTKGYEQMTIQDILDELHISKGAFYHYFVSKSDLLSAIIDRMQKGALQVVQPIVEDPELDALEKFHRLFSSLASWKAEQKEIVLVLLKVWYADENVLLREKMQLSSVKLYAPLLGQIIRQGMQEGVFSNPYPDQVGEVAFSVIMDISDSVGEGLLTSILNGSGVEELEATVAAYSYALECMIGAPTGSLKLIEPEDLRQWFVKEA
jgi:AcrR family transcriptional regulator